MNGNISKDGIAKDIAWMKRIGIGGLQNFDAAMQTPQVVDKRLSYMSPEWKEAFRFAAGEADRNGLELAIAASPGWSETGGPWVKPEDGMKKLVWSETRLKGGKRFAGKLLLPPAVTGPFQSLAKEAGMEQTVSGDEEHHAPSFYKDVAILAVPMVRSEILRPQSVHDARGHEFGPETLSDGDLKSAISVDQPNDGASPTLQFDFPQKVSARSASIYLPDIMVPFLGAAHRGTLEASDDGSTWRKVADLPLGEIPTTISFPKQSAKHFRVLFRRVDTVRTLGEPAPGVMEDKTFAGMIASMMSKPIKVGDFRLSTEARVHRFEAKAGFAVASDYYDLADPEETVSGPSATSVIDLTSKIGADGMLEWRPPEGEWRILRLGYSLLGTTNHPAAPEATGLEVDKFDADAVRRYLEHYIGMYRDAAGPDLIGKHGVRALLTDSIEVGPANWTPHMVEQFRRLRGYDPLPWLPALTGTIIASRADSDRFLYDYRRTLADLLASEHYGTVASVAHEHGLSVYGEALEDHRPSLGDDMAMRSHADVPMAAMWAYSRKVGPKATFLADMKGAASTAHIYGQNVVAAESMTSAMAPWDFAPKDLKHVIDLEFVNGINRPIIHTSVHVPVENKKPGLSLFIFGQHFNRLESWSEMAKPWIDYMARSSFMLQQGKNVADVAYFYGEEAPLTGLYGDKPVADAPSAYAYDFLNFGGLSSLQVTAQNELVVPSGARYRAIYLGGTSTRMSLAALRKLADLVDKGATVVGKRPVADPGFAPGSTSAEWSSLVDRLWPAENAAPRVGQKTVIADDNIEDVLSKNGVAPDFSFSGTTAPVPFVHRRSAQADIYYLSSPSADARRITAKFRITGKVPELWQPETGQTSPVSYKIVDGQTVVPLNLLPSDAFFIVFRNQATTNSLTLPSPAFGKAAILDRGWTVRFEEGRGAPASYQMRELAH